MISLLSPDILENAKGEQIEGFFDFMRLDPNAKDGEQWPLLGEYRLFACTVRYDMVDHGLTILFDDDLQNWQKCFRQRRIIFWALQIIMAVISLTKHLDCFRM